MKYIGQRTLSELSVGLYYRSTLLLALHTVGSLSKDDLQSLRITHSFLPEQNLAMEPDAAPGVSLYSAIELRFRAILPVDFHESDQLFKSINESEAYKWIYTSECWDSARVCLEPRIEGMMKTGQGFISTINTSHLFADETCNRWPALVLGSLALCIRVISEEFDPHHSTALLFMIKFWPIKILNRPRS